MGRPGCACVRTGLWLQRFVTRALLPAQLRAMFEMEWTEADERRWPRFRRWAPRVYWAMPAFLRHLSVKLVLSQMQVQREEPRWSSCAGVCGLRNDSLLSLHSVQRCSAPRPITRCSPMPSAAKISLQSTSTCNSNTPMAATTSARWWNIDPAFRRREARASAGQIQINQRTGVNESNPASLDK